jgi:hypothetical protein
MSLDRAAEILTWPVAELDRLRLSLRMQVWRIVFIIGMKAMLEGKLGRERNVSVPSKRSLPGSAPGCGTAASPRLSPRYGETRGSVTSTLQRGVISILRLHAQVA